MGKRGLTLLELLVLIGIPVILITITVFALNTGELLNQIKDSQKISELNNLKAALSLYLLTNLEAGCEDSDSPLADLPPGFSYICDEDTKTFELNVDIESVRYSQGGSDDVESSDGGDRPDLYEVGNNLNL